jgi:hypothetical protein
LNFCASLHQKRFTKWSRIDSSGSHKSVSATWIAERIYDSYYNEKLKRRKSLVAILKGLFGGCKSEEMRISYNGERPLKNPLFCPISASGSDFNPQNTQCIPAVKIFAFLELEQN